MRRILSIDGGGIRGVFPVAVLAALEEDLDEPLYRYFDLIAGTSTGGIIAIGLSLGMSAREILAFYEEFGPRIFGQTRTGTRGFLDRRLASARWYVWGPKYRSKELSNALQTVLAEKRLGEAKTRVMIPAWHHLSQRVYIFKTPHHECLQTDYRELARDVAMATAAAPTYFEAHITQRDVGLVDGGVWANNPTGVAVAEAVGTLGWNPSELQVLSIGCLEDVHEMRDASGAIRLSTKQAGLFMAGQSHGSMGLAHVLTGHVGGSDHRAIYRVSQPVPNSLYTLDDTSKIKNLKSRAYAEAREQKPNLKRVFFQETVEPYSPIYEVDYV